MAFATADDIATRLGRSLTDDERSQATSVIADVTGLIADAASRDAAWATALTPVPVALKALCVKKAISVISNPLGLASESERLGQHEHAQTFPRNGDGVDVFLTEAEERRVNWAIYGSNSGSSSPEAPVDRFVDIWEGREPDVDPVV